VGEDTRQIAQEIRAERHDLERNIDELQEHAKALTDWRTHYRRNTGASLVVAFSGGVFLGLLAAGSRPSGGHRLSGETDDTSAVPAWPEESKPGKLAALKNLADNPRARQQVGDAWDHMLEALIAVASTKAIELIGSFVPGFHDEYHARATERPTH
jgi:hypothetical protein